MAIIRSVSFTLQEATGHRELPVRGEERLREKVGSSMEVLPSRMAVGPSAKRATTASVMATSGILFMLTSTAFRRFPADAPRGGPVTVTLVSVQVTFAPIISRTSANFTSPCEKIKSDYPDEFSLKNFAEHGIAAKSYLQAARAAAFDGDGATSDGCASQEITGARGVALDVGVSRRPAWGFGVGN